MPCFPTADHGSGYFQFLRCAYISGDQNTVFTGFNDMSIAIQGGRECPHYFGVLIPGSAKCLLGKVVVSLFKVYSGIKGEYEMVILSIGGFGT